MIEISSYNGILISSDGEVTHFIPIETTPKQKTVDNRSFWTKISDWYKNLFVKPYVKIRDLADPFGDRTDIDAGSDGKSAAEIGIRIDF